MSNKISKRLLSLLLALLLLAVTGCGGEKSSGSLVIPEDGYQLRREDQTDALATPTKTLDPASVYAGIDYVPEMFYGEYALKGSLTGFDNLNKQDLVMDEYFASIGFDTYVGTDGEKTATAMPHGFTAGPSSLHHKITDAKEHKWIRLNFQTEGNNLYWLTCAMEIVNKQLYCYPMIQYEYTEATDSFTYTLAEEAIVYDFAFEGPNLTLRREGKSVTLYPDSLMYGYNSVDHYATSTSPKIENIELISYYYDVESKDGQRFYLTTDEKETIRTAVARMDPNGLFTMSWTDADGKVHAHQFVYFYCRADGIVLSDGQTHYFYQHDWFERGKSVLSGSIAIEQKSQLEALPENKLEEIVERRNSLFKELSDAFASANLPVSVDPVTGEIALDSAVLFGFDESALSEEGKAFLQQFLSIYADVVFGEAYTGFVSKVMIEGHTDSTGDYDYNLQLSQQRADEVLAFCTSAENGLDASDTQVLSGVLEAIGRSYDAPILDANGQEDAAASRRVAFRFLISLE